MKNFLTSILLISIGILNSQLKEVLPEEIGVSSERIKLITDLSEDYIKSNKVTGIVNIISRKGKIVYFEASGNRGIDDNTPMKKNDLFRIYSMTKPITAVAAMQLYEKGKFNLDDLVSKFIPELKDLKILDSENNLKSVKNKMTMLQLLTHTAGFSYGFNPNDIVDKKYTEADLWNSKDLDEFAEKISELPLKFEPGSKWHYSIAVDLTGLVIERISGKTLDDYFNENIFTPLGMNDTFFEVPNKKLNRFLPNHYYDYENKKIVKVNSQKKQAMSDYNNVTLYSGGGGLVSTAMDYMIFAESLRNGGAFNGNRILSPKTINFMTKNHLSASLSNEGGSGENPSWDTTSSEEADNSGFGFGLGFGLVTNTVARKIIGSDGEYSWGGAAGTIFWIDPIEELVVVTMIQLMSSPWKLREDMKIATYQSLIESYE